MGEAEGSPLLSVTPHTLIFTFNNVVNSGNAEVTTNNANVSSVSFPGDKTMQVELSDVGDAQLITVKLKDVFDENSQTLPDTSVSMIVLLGDTNANKQVNATDISQTKSQVGKPLSQANFREDVTVSGDINSSDVIAVKLNSGNGVAAAPSNVKANRIRSATR